MGVIPEKNEYRNCPPERVKQFCDAISAQKLCEKVTFTPADERSHFDRYGFIKNGKKVIVVYDVKAKILSVTAFDDIAPALFSLYNKIANAKADAPQIQPKKEDKKQPVKANKQKGKVEEKAQKQAEKASNKPNKDKQTTKPNPSQRTENAPKKEEKKVEKKADKKVDKKPEKVTPKKAQKQAEVAKENVVAKVEPKQKESVITPENESDHGGITFKKFANERFDEVVEKLGKDKRLKLKMEAKADKGKPTEVVTYTITGDKQKLKLRYMPKKLVLQLQGKQEALFSEIRLILSEQTDYRSAVDAHIEQSSEDKKASEVERQLKKLIPHALPYLTDQVKLDFTIGVIEILNSTVTHYDYSMLLLPAFRGLERLIFDVQHAQNVVVKMIGQAYEKQNGEYVLKASYCRKINSVVYPEVLAALYREYFATRNFYTHSDSSEKSQARVLSSRQDAIDVFNEILAVVEYNCRKLSEIGFTLSPDDKPAPQPKPAKKQKSRK
ncbi:MAG: type II toxin-antitoxin system RnlA family toxin [Clostridia bacterium]|nr:type II toxin-antitoxin system RnlA family toxin [Clostridia bacterium]